MSQSREDDGCERAVEVGIAIMFVLMGVAVVFAVYLGRGTFSMGFFPFSMIIGWAIGLLILFWIMRGIFWGGWWCWWETDRHRARRSYRRHGDAYYILKERYARGDVTRKEYEEKMKDLESY